jgi:DNA helicase IV
MEKWRESSPERHQLACRGQQRSELSGRADAVRADIEKAKEELANALEKGQADLAKIEARQKGAEEELASALRHLEAVEAMRENEERADRTAEAVAAARFKAEWRSRREPKADELRAELEEFLTRCVWQY